MLTLLTARTTDTSYPTDVALQKVWFTAKDASEILVCQPEITGVMDGATVGFNISTDGGTTWSTGTTTATAIGFPTAFYMLPGWSIRPTVASAGASTSITLKLFP
jgi:hypothetical protein